MMPAESMFKVVVDQVSLFTIPLMFCLIILYGKVKRVKVYESFVEGGKEGFDIFIQILPYIVAILVAIGMFRISGALEFISEQLAPYTLAIGMEPETLPVALMKPLSGSGALGMVADVVNESPDSFGAKMASTMFGSTDTTFYVIALYFGSVGIRKIRHAMVAGLTADLAGILAAVWISHAAFGGENGASAGYDSVLAGRLDATLNKLAGTGAVCAANVVELSEDGGRVLYVKDGDRPVVPASNMKILVSATALDRLGSDHDFETFLVADGDDLWIVGSGDPGTGDPRLAKHAGGNPLTMFDEWADALAVRGIQDVAGDLIYYDGALEDKWVHPTWRGSSLHWYGAPVSGLNFNDNCVDITVLPAEAGQLVRYEVMPPVSEITIHNHCITGDGGSPTVEKSPEGNIYNIEGACRRRTDLKSKPVDNPGRFFADALKTHLEMRRIKIRGGIRHGDHLPDFRSPQHGENVIAVHRTAMIDVLSRVNTNSQNLFAECLCKISGKDYDARRGTDVPGSWKSGELAIRLFLRKNGIDDGQLVVADGSGLSHSNRVTARMLTDVLVAMHKHADGAVFRKSMAQPGHGGSLGGRLADLEGRVFVKTGFIGGVRALCGYVKTADNKWVAFCFIYNEIKGNVRPFERLQDEACRVLASWSDGG